MVHDYYKKLIIIIIIIIIITINKSMVICYFTSPSNLIIMNEWKWVHACAVSECK